MSLSFMSKYAAAAAAVLSPYADQFIKGAKNAAYAELDQLGRQFTRSSTNYIKGKLADLYNTGRKGYSDPFTTPVKKRSSKSRSRASPATSPFTRSVRDLVRAYAGPPPVHWRNPYRQNYRGFRRSGRIYFPKRRRRYTRRRFSRR